MNLGWKLFSYYRVFVMSMKNEKSVAHLESHIKDLQKTILNLELEGDQFVLDMETLEQNLKIPEKLVANLKTLDQSLVTLDKILDLIIIIPQITIGGRELKKAIDVIKIPIHKARVVSSDFDMIMKNVLTAVAKLKVKIQTLDYEMEVKRDKVARFNTLVNKTVQCISSIPVGDPREKQYDEMIQASVEVDTQVKNAIKLLLLIEDSLDRINKEVEQIDKRLKFLEELSEPIEKITFELNLITVPLKPLMMALSHRISVPYERAFRYCKKWGIPYPCGWHTVHAKFSVNQILSGLSGIFKPIEDMLLKEMNVFLKPMLKSLHFKTKLSSVPELDSLSAKLQALFANFVTLPKEVDELLKKAGQLEKEIDLIHEKHGQWQQMQETCRKIK